MADRAGVEETAINRALDVVDGLITAAPGLMGTPPGAQRYSQDEQLAMWNKSPIADPRQRVDAMLTLKQQGKTNEEITDLIYPERRKLAATGRTRAAEQIQFARDMARLMDQKSQEYAAEMQASSISAPAFPAQDVRDDGLGNAEFSTESGLSDLTSGMPTTDLLSKTISEF